MSEQAHFYERRTSVTDGVVLTIGGRASCIRELRAYADFGAGVTAGTLLVETASHEDYAGDWATVGTMAWAAASGTKTVAITGLYAAIRLRWSVAVAGGVADVTVLGN